MRFTTARLCGGKSLMAVPADPMDIDISKVPAALGIDPSAITSSDEEMMVFQWNGMETTLYRQGKVMFFPLEDKAACIKYATQILEALRRFPTSGTSRYFWHSIIYRYYIGRTWTWFWSWQPSR
ncbi:MAG: hypothetical protein II933_04885 [Candidatus Methanomethylophilaceae archaeon]|nr:hypothetical protein [Candidatus Methanomethylophilaceae archaeon]